MIGKTLNQQMLETYGREQMGKRVEEGIAILVRSNSPKSFSIAKTQTLFLPRNFEDSR